VLKLSRDSTWTVLWRASPTIKIAIMAQSYVGHLIVHTRENKGWEGNPPSGGWRACVPLPLEDVKEVR
jgi:hypothetical protein